MGKRSIGMESNFPQSISREKALFYAYIAGYEIGIKWPNLEKDNEDEQLLRLYLESLDLDEYDKMYVINELSDKTKKKLKQELRTTFASVAASKRWELKIPQELSEQNVFLDIDLIDQFKKVTEERDFMENDEVMDGVGEEVPVQEPVKKAKKVVQATEPAPANTAVPESNKELTLETFQAAFGKRYRMTKEQKARNLTREQAFAEWKSSQK